ncbi:MAG: hypothetical protein ABIA67_01200 [Candidatus Margulisiibacteriota bacterium]
MFHVISKGNFAGRLGGFAFSRGPMLDRAMVVKQWDTPTVPFSSERLQQVVNNGQRNVLLAMSWQFLPTEITQHVEAANLRQDLEAHSEQVVFCSGLWRDVSGDPMTAEGLVIEVGEGQTFPFRFAEQEVAALSGNGFLPSPERAIFINIDPAAAGRVDAAFDHFPTLAYFLGYLKSKADLSASGIDPDSASHELRSFYAASYFFLAARELHNRPSHPGNTSQLLEYAENQLLPMRNALSTEDSFLLRQLNLLERMG